MAVLCSTAALTLGSMGPLALQISFCSPVCGKFSDDRTKCRAWGRAPTRKTAFKVGPQYRAAVPRVRNLDQFNVVVC